MVLHARSPLVPQCWPLCTRISSARAQPSFRRNLQARYTGDDSVDADPDYALGRPVFQDNTRYPALRQAEQDIREYCQTIDDEQQYQKCINTLQRLKDEKQKAYQGISVLENAVDAQETLERLESMARELSSCKSSKLMVDALAHLQQMQDRYGPGGEQEGVVREVLQAEERERKAEVRERLRDVFDRVDTNGNGVVDIAEFRAAMDSLGKHLDGFMVAEICQALDIHAGLTFEQFCDIVDAEEVRSPEAARLRALIHNSPDDHYAEWIKSWC